MDFTGLKKLQKVGDHWLFECSALTKVDLRGLDQLTQVGRDSFAECPSLTTVLFDKYSTFHTCLSKTDYGSPERGNYLLAVKDSTMQIIPIGQHSFIVKNTLILNISHPT